MVLDIDPLELTKGIVEGREQELPVKLADEDLGPAEALLEDPEGGKPELTTLEHVHHNVVVEVAQLSLHLAPKEQAVEAQLDERPLGVHQRSVAPIDERALLLVLRLQTATIDFKVVFFSWKMRSARTPFVRSSSLRRFERAASSSIRGWTLRPLMNESTDKVLSCRKTGAFMTTTPFSVSIPTVICWRTGRLPIVNVP